MAPTYKDLAKTWLSNWPAGVRAEHTLRACVHARRNRGRVQVWKGAQTVSRSLHGSVLHITPARYRRPGIRASLPENGDSRRYFLLSRVSLAYVRALALLIAAHIESLRNHKTLRISRARTREIY